MSAALQLAGLMHYTTTAQGMYTARSQNNQTRGVVLCAHNHHTLRLAWTQIRALQYMYGMNNETFTVYHADELNLSDNTIRAAVQRLESLPNVRIESLRGWYMARYREEGDESGIKRFQGFFCKVGALLAAPYEIVALIDTEVVLSKNPFELINTDTFRERGSYLFRDRRLSAEYWGQSSGAYRERLTKLWQSFHPDRPDNISSALLSSPPFTGWSYDHGESAVVLFDKSRHEPATGILAGMVGSDLFATTSAGLLGDKETYWQALALADVEPGMNAFACSEVGILNEHGETCTHSYTVAQWMFESHDCPHIFYVNGDGVEHFIAGEDDTLLRAWVSDPLFYFSSRTRIDYLGFRCNTGANPLPSYVREAMHAYRLFYEQYDSVDV